MMAGWQRAKYWLRNAGSGALVFVSVLAVASTAHDPSVTSFIKTSGTTFTLDGKPFFVTGVNSRHLTYGSQDEVTRVLDDAVAMGANVVRNFLQPVIGSLDGSVATIWDWRLEGDASVVICADHTRSLGRFERPRRGGAPPDHRPVYRRVWEHIGSSSRENS